MKKLSVTLLAIFLLSAAFAAWYSGNQTLYSGIHPNTGWNQTMTIAAGNNVRFTGSTNFAGGHLVIEENATLTIQSGGLSANGSITLEAGASLIVNGALLLNTAGSTLRVTDGTVTVSGNFTQSSNLVEIGNDGVVEVGGNFLTNGGGLSILDGGILRANNATFNGNNSIAGLLEVTQTTRVNGGNIAFSGCGEVRTRTLNIQNGNLFSGNGFVVVSQTYTNGRSSTWSGHALTSSNAIGVYYTGAATTANWGGAYMNPTANNPCLYLLPVQFEKFKAIPQASNNYMLEWTAPETEETESYEIQVSDDNINFRTIEIVPAKGERGDLRYQQKVHLGY
ncbi:polymer-forming cytoskeletal protein [Flavihumibacter sp. UBA7668]|uniref:polymer-forming cytoskeletal protein n=1 Tax=Flavihumibacter sp. UBA7668 TaxID=1946542 RepID=UPI0025BF4805|nr:polymer-forming cytoskeletal protein [Flavihumibacter sp. UBA7668]